MSFIDIHSHILHGLDDGPATLDESVAMLTVARQEGTTAIIATPHANGRYPFDPVVIQGRIADLTGRVDIQICPGCDFHLHAENILDALAHPEKYTLNHQSYLLVEFPDSHAFHGAGDILRRLLDAGMIPVISHPERNPHLQRAFALLAEWVHMGCCVQATAASYTGLFGKDATNSAHALLRRGLVHVVASDAHDARLRPPGLRQAYELLLADYEEDSMRRLFADNPGAMLEGESFDAAPPRARRGKKRWFRLWS